MIETDILIIGGGSGGFGAAIRAARAEPGARILLAGQHGTAGRHLDGGGCQQLGAGDRGAWGAL